MKRPWALPLVPLYAAGSALRWAPHDWLGIQPHKLARPVISIGSLSAGGAGKTPFVIALAKALIASGQPVDLLSRGYGRTSHEALEVQASGSADTYGDEPLLIAQSTAAPVFVAASRLHAGRLAESTCPSAIHLLDDGFQHRQLHRDVDIVLVSSADLADSLLPAGDRREPLSALRRATALAVPEDDDAAIARIQTLLPSLPPLWRYRRRMTVPTIDGPVLAFCGIARPAQFFRGLQAAGLRLAAQQSFPDHHRFTSRDLDALQSIARASGVAALITTAKDAVRLGDQAPLLAFPLTVAALEVQLLDQAALLAWLQQRLG